MLCQDNREADMPACEGTMSRGGNRIRQITPEEASILDALLRKSGEPEAADLFAFMLATGTTLIEATRIEWPDFLREDRVSLIEIEPKMRARRPLPRVLELTPLWATKFMERRAKGYASPFGIARWKASKLWGEIQEPMGWTEERSRGLPMTVLRDTFGCRLVREGALPEAIQRAMGHRDTRSTQFYLFLDLEAPLRPATGEEAAYSKRLNRNRPGL